MSRIPWKKLLADRKYNPMSIERDGAPPLSEHGQTKKEEHAGSRVKNYTRVFHPDGYSFDSKFEAFCYEQLKSLVLAGELSELRVKHRVYLTAARIGWNIDFSAVSTATGEREWFEAKGWENEVYSLKKRLYRLYGPGKLHILKGYSRKTDQKMWVEETIHPDRPVDTSEHFPFVRD